MKNKMLLILNCFYTMFLISFVFTLLLAGINDSIVLHIICVFLIVMTEIGMWLIYAKKDKAGLIIIKIKNILKYIFIVVLIAFLMFILFAFQNCGYKDNVPFSERLKIIIPLGSYFLIITGYFVSYFLFIKTLNNPNKVIQIIFMICEVLLILWIIMDVVLLWNNGDEGILNMFFSTLKNNENVVIKILLTISTLIYELCIGIVFVHLIKNLKKR